MKIDRFLKDQFLTDDKLLTMVHGDLWINNLLVDENQTQVKFIDFQQMHPGHPSRDFWYYLYSCTDVEWRKLHLEEVMRTYFTHLLTYLKKAQMEVNFEAFRKEMNQFRETGFLLAFIVLPIMLHPGIPSPPDLKTWKGFKQFYAWRDKIFSRPIKYNEHSMVKEINRRLLENIEEAFTLGLLK